MGVYNENKKTNQNYDEDIKNNQTNCKANKKIFNAVLISD